MLKQFDKMTSMRIQTPFPLLLYMHRLNIHGLIITGVSEAENIIDLATKHFSFSLCFAYNVHFL